MKKTYWEWWDGRPFSRGQPAALRPHLHWWRSPRHEALEKAQVLEISPPWARVLARDPWASHWPCCICKMGIRMPAYLLHKTLSAKIRDKGASAMKASSPLLFSSITQIGYGKELRRCHKRSLRQADNFKMIKRFYQTGRFSRSLAVFSCLHRCCRYLTGTAGREPQALPNCPRGLKGLLSKYSKS